MRYSLLVAFLLLVCCGASEAYSGDSTVTARFEHVPILDNAPGNSVRCMVQDAAGFAWFGTKHGLVRHDGYSLFVYRRDSEDSASLANENVAAGGFEDVQKILFIRQAA